MKYPYIVIDAPGYYGSRGRVYSRHKTFPAAQQAKGGKEYAVAWNDDDRYRKGDEFWADMSPTLV